MYASIQSSIKDKCHHMVASALIVCSELLIRLELTGAYAPVGLYLQSTQPSFEKEGYGGRQPAMTTT